MGDDDRFRAVLRRYRHVICHIARILIPIGECIVVTAIRRSGRVLPAVDCLVAFIDRCCVQQGSVVVIPVHDMGDDDRFRTVLRSYRHIISHIARILIPSGECIVVTAIRRYGRVLARINGGFPIIDRRAVQPGAVVVIPVYGMGDDDRLRAVLRRHCHIIRHIARILIPIGECIVVAAI